MGSFLLSWTPHSVLQVCKDLIYCNNKFHFAFTQSPSPLKNASNLPSPLPYLGDWGIGRGLLTDGRDQRALHRSEQLELNCERPQHGKERHLKTITTVISRLHPVHQKKYAVTSAIIPSAGHSPFSFSQDGCRKETEVHSFCSVCCLTGRRVVSQILSSAEYPIQTEFSRTLHRFESTIKNRSLPARALMLC